MPSTGTFKFRTPIMDFNTTRVFELTTPFGTWNLRVWNNSFKQELSVNLEMRTSKCDHEVNINIKYYIGLDINNNNIEFIISNNAKKQTTKSSVEIYADKYSRYARFDVNNYELKFEITMKQISKDPVFKPPAALPNSLASYFSNVFDNDKFADISLETSDGKMVKANKVVLARSPVFDAMFNHDTQEAQQRVVQITDMTHDALKELVRYIYTDEVPKLKEYAVDLLIAANKYDFPGLFEICERYLKSNPTVGNLTRAVEFAELLELGDVVNSLIKFIINNKDVVFESDEWKSMEKNNPALGMRIMKACMKFKD